MDSSINIEVGQVVRSKAGRDKGRVFLVYEVLNEGHVTVVDGDLRRLDKPKLKKIKHLSLYNTVNSEFKDRIENQQGMNNAFVRKILEPFK